MTVNALTAVDGALLITEPRASVEGLAQTTRTMVTVRQHARAPFDPIGAAAVP